MTISKRLALTGEDIHIYGDSHTLKGGTVEIEGQHITGILELEASGTSAADLPQGTIKLPAGCHVMPGMIDLHIHGAQGSDVMDGTRLALHTIAKALAKEGTTRFLATTMTESTDHINKALKAIKDYTQNQPSDCAQIAGVHLEGPFLSPKKAGAQNAGHFQDPSIDLMQQFIEQSGQQIKLVTLAPELPNAHTFIQYLVSQNIMPSIGHTDATYAQAIESFKQGIGYATHLFNAMRGIDHREPGATGAILLSPEIIAELIVDDIHLHPKATQLAYQMKGKEQLILVTDSIRAKCMGDGEYELGGQHVTVKGNCASLDNGALAGSILTLNQAAKNMRNHTKCNMEDLIHMTSYNPAKLLGLSDITGSITRGKLADITVLDEDMNTLLTLCQGNIIYQA